LDPEERIRIRNLLTELAGGRVIILSTHIVGDVAGSAGDLALLRRGAVVFHGAPSTLVSEAEGKVWWVNVPDDEVRLLAKQLPVTHLERTSRGVRARVLAENPARQFPSLSFETTPANLEDAYIWVMDDATLAAAAKDDGESSSLVGLVS